MAENDYISLQEATKYCDYSQEYLSLRARQGKLKAIKFGRNWVTKKEWLDEYLKNDSRKYKKVERPAISFSNIFKQPKLRYALRYAIAGVLVFSLLTIGVVFDFNKDTLLLSKDILIKTGTELSIAASDTMLNIVKEMRIGSNQIAANLKSIKKPSLPELPGLSIPNISIPDIDLHPIQDFKDTMAFISDIEIPEIEIPDVKLPKIEIPKIAFPELAFPEIEIPPVRAILTKAIGGSIVNSKTFLNQSLIKINKSVDEWSQGIIAISDTLEAETKNFFYNLGASILLTSEDAKYFLAEAVEGASDDIKYGLNIFQKFSRWYGEQAVIVSKIIKEEPSNIGDKIVNTGITFKQGYQSANDIVEKKLSQAYKFLVSPWGERPEEKEEIVVEKEKTDEEIKQKLEVLQARIEKMEREGLPQKEIIKEIQRITQIEPIKEITKELKVLDEESLAEFKTQLAAITGWEADIENLQAITKKLQATPPQTVVSSAPIYIASQGIQVGGHGSFASLGVSGSAAVHDLSVGDDTVLGGDSSDKLTVAAASTFSGPVTINNTLTQSTGNVTFGGDVSAQGDMTVTGDLTVTGAQAYSGAAIFTVSSSSDGLRVNQQGTGNIARFQTDGTDNFVIANGGQATITSANSPQLTVAYDSSNYISVAVDNNGDLTFTATGGDISFGDENITTTGNITAGALSVSASGNITMADDTWIGLGAAAGRLVFDSTPTPDTLTINTASLLFSADNTYDIGASGATRPRTGYFGTSVMVAGTTTTLADGSLTFTSLTPSISIGDTGTLSITDGVNSLMTIFDSGTTGNLTINDITMPDGGTIGKVNGPILTFDDTNNYLEITGASVGIGTTGPDRRLDVLESTTSIPQLRLTQQDNTNYAEMYVDATGDLSVGLTGSGGDDIYILDENLWVCTGGTFGSVSCPNITLSTNGNLVVESDLYVEGNISFGDTSNKTGSFTGFTLAQTKEANITGLITDNPVVRKIQLYISNDPTADTNINFRLSFYNSNSMTEDELIKDFYFNLTYTETNGGASETDTTDLVDNTSGLLKYDLIRYLDGDAENVRITTVTDATNLDFTALAGDHADNSGVVKVAEFTDLFQLYDDDFSKEIHAKLETFSAPNASMNVAISLDLQ